MRYYLISEIAKYVRNAILKLKGLPLAFLTRDLKLRLPSSDSEILIRISNLKHIIYLLSFHLFLDTNSSSSVANKKSRTLFFWAEYY